MTHDTQPQLAQTPPILGVLTHEQVTTLGSVENDRAPVAREILETLGEGALSASVDGGVALFLSEKEGIPYAAYVSLNSSNIGDRLNARTQESLGLPDPQSAYEKYLEEQVHKAEEADTSATTTSSVTGTTAESNEEQVLQATNMPEKVVEPIQLQPTENQVETAEVTTASRAMQELRDQWGLPEESTVEQVVGRLNTTLEELDALQMALSPDSKLSNSLVNLKDKLRMAIGDQRAIAPRVVASALEELVTVRAEIVRLPDQKDLLLPGYAKNELDNTSTDIRRLQDVLGGITPRPGFMDIDSANQGYRMLLDGKVDQISEQVARLRREVEQKQIDLIGYDAVTGVEATEPTEKFAHDRIQEIANKLRSGEMSAEEVEHATLSLERYIDDAIADGSSKVQYPSRVVKNDPEVKKTRLGGSQEGQSGLSRRVAAEIANDMLRGKFDFTREADPITLAADGSVLVGQHRAAALMTLYGQNWAKAGMAHGHKIVNKR